MVILVDADTDFQRKIRIPNLPASALKKTDFFQSIGSVGKEFTQKDLVVGIKRMRQNIKQLARFRAKLMCGFRHGTAS